MLLPLEEAILRIGLGRLGTSEPEFYGFSLAEELESGEGAERLLGHGALYKALGRLERGGLLESRWEDIVPAEEGRPRRRLYKVTGQAAAALAASHALSSAASHRTRLAST